MNVALRSDSLNILSICTGGAGLDLGLELAVQGARTVCMVEREAFAVAQLVSAMEACLLASAPIWSDARTFNGRQWRGAVDGLIGGIPCQPHSLAGKRLAEEDERDLWSTARRIIVQSGVWFVLIENVRGMLSSGGAARVRRDLHRLGFAVEGGLFTASEVGASHERERLFILAVSDRNVGQANADGQYGDGARIERQGRRRQPSNGRTEVSSVGLADANSERLEGERPDDGTIGRQDARGSAGLRDGASLVDRRSALDIYSEFQEFGCMEYTSRVGRGEGRSQSEFRSGRGASASASLPMVNSIGSRHDRRQDGSVGNEIGRTIAEGAGVCTVRSMGDTSIERSGTVAVRKPATNEEDTHVNGTGLFPPGPNDLTSWRNVLERAPELEPAFRRVANGLASRLDVARVDRLRMLGNGVVPLESAYAFRTLSTRLATRGSAGAARLVRMMGE